MEATPDLAKGTATVRLKARVRNASKQAVTPKLTTVVSLDNQPLKLVWKTSSSSVGAGQTSILEAETSLKVPEVKLWNLDEPTLYQLQAAMSGDTLSTNFGIRKVEVQNAQILLNGQPIRLAGGNRSLIILA